VERKREKKGWNRLTRLFKYRMKKPAQASKKQRSAKEKVWLVLSKAEGKGREQEEQR